MKITAVRLGVIAGWISEQRAFAQTGNRTNSRDVNQQQRIERVCSGPVVDPEEAISVRADNM